MATTKKQQKIDKVLSIEDIDISELNLYNGNPLLKAANQPIRWTKKLVEEYMKCANDPVYFMKKYIKIITGDGLVNFDMYDFQEELVGYVKDNPAVCACWGRQQGKSTTIVGIITWYIVFHSEKTVAILANKEKTAKEILGRVQLAYMHLPKWMQQGVVEWNKQSFSLENNSRVISAATSADSIRGFSVDFLYIDEAAIIDPQLWEEFFTSTYPTISSRKDAKIVLTSTPKGLNFFHSIFKGAMEKRNSYIPHMVKWNRVPGRTEEWKAKTLSEINNDTEKFAQEYDCEFIGSSGTLIAGWKLKELSPSSSIYESDGLYQFNKPEKGHAYVCIVDTSRGKGLDYSAFQMIDISEMPYKQVAIYRNNMVTPLDYASLLLASCKNYNNASVLVENNDGSGVQVVESLHYDYEYEYIFYTENYGNKGKRISNGFKGNAERGIRTSRLVKSVGCSMLKLLIEQNQLIINDQYTINELNTFSQKNNSYEAESGCHDDLVMCLVLFAWLTDQDYFKSSMDIHTLMKLRDKSDDEIMEDLVPFGFTTSGEVEEYFNSGNTVWGFDDEENIYKNFF